MKMMQGAVISHEKYRSELGELVPKIVLKQLSNLELEKVKEERKNKTPDYEIKNQEGIIVAICEVKSLVDTLNPLDFNLNDSQKLKVLSDKSDKRNRNHRSKLQKHHDSAMLQLRDRVDLLRVVVFVSFDMTDCIDMRIMLAEHKEIYPLSLMADLYILMKVHQSRIPSESFEITETIMTLYNSNKGKCFAEKYLCWDEILKRVDDFPLTFNLTSCRC